MLTGEKRQRRKAAGALPGAHVFLFRSLLLSAPSSCHSGLPRSANKHSYHLPSVCGVHGMQFLDWALLLFCKGRTRGPERLGDLPDTTQLVSGGTGVGDSALSKGHVFESHATLATELSEKQSTFWDIGVFVLSRSFGSHVKVKSGLRGARGLRAWRVP